MGMEPNICHSYNNKKRDKRLNIVCVWLNNTTVELKRNAKGLTSKMNSSSHQKPYLPEVNRSQVGT